MTSQSNTFKLIDGYAMSSSVQYTITSEWVDLHSCALFSVTAVFTGGSPSGTMILECSNDRKWTGATVVQPLHAASADNSSGTTKSVSDVKAVPTSGTGTATVSISGAGVYIMNQFLAPYRWVRVKYTASNSVDSQLDVFMHMKNI